MTFEDEKPTGSKNTAVCCQTENPENRNDDKCSIITIICRICYDSEKDEPIVSPCDCKGTVAYVHRSCLETWLAESNTTACELCHHIYKTCRFPKYSVNYSIWRWMRRETPNFGFNVRSVRSDCMACMLLTPLAIAITYICLFSADYYSQQRFAHIPAAKWTSVSLLIMVVIMLIGYYLWAYMAIKYHSRVWYYWWQRECIVRIPSEEIHFSGNNQDENNETNYQAENQNITNNTFSIQISENILADTSQQNDVNSIIIDENSATNDNVQNSNLSITQENSVKITDYSDDLKLNGTIYFNNDSHFVYKNFLNNKNISQ